MEYHVYGYLDNSGCAHGVTVSRQTALRLLRAARRQNARMVRDSYGRKVEICQHSLRELFRGYRYSHLELSIMR